MPIKRPGEKFRRHRVLSRRRTGRDVVAVLSLTAMVDMFTVLVVFLLQNYQADSDLLKMSDKVNLPQASTVKQVEPAHVVTVSKEMILLGSVTIVDFASVKRQDEWLVQPLFKAMVEALSDQDTRLNSAIRKKFREAVAQGKTFEEDFLRRVTVQADKAIDFLTIKKVMYTVAESGASQINFAVLQNKK